MEATDNTCLLCREDNDKKEAVSKVIYCRKGGKAGRKQQLIFNVYRLADLPAKYAGVTFEQLLFFQLIIPITD